MKRQRLDIRDWEAFVTLTRLRHFGHAADELGITQSAISQRIAKLEGDLRLKLLVRSNQGVALTDAGLALLPEARALIAAKRSALELAAAIREEGARPLRLLLSNAIIHTAILPKLREALEKAQGPAYQVDVEAADEVETSLASGECDLAVTTLPMAREDVEERLLTRLPMAVAVPADVELKQVQIKTLCRHPLLMVPRDTEPDLFDRLAGGCPKRRPGVAGGPAHRRFPLHSGHGGHGEGLGHRAPGHEGRDPRGREGSAVADARASGHPGLHVLAFLQCLGG